MYHILLSLLGQSFHTIKYLITQTNISLDPNTACGCEFHHDENHMYADVKIEQLPFFSFTII
jgi:hypothetical protein